MLKQMKNFTALTAIVALFGLASSLVAGDITGKVVLKGTPPPEKPYTPLKNDPNCGKLVTETPKTTFYVVGEGGGFGDVVVSLEGVSGKSTGASAPPVELDQEHCLYVPYVLAVQTGQKIRVKNSDPVLHNVHCTPKVAGNMEKNLAQMPNGPDVELAFAAPEDFLRFKCDVHPWMFAYVSVFDHPYFAVTDKNGNFKIANVPPGKYKIVAKHRKAAPKGVTQEIEVTDAGATANMTIELK